MNNFKPIALQVTRYYPPLINNTQVTVSAMSAPVGLAYAMKYIYGEPVKTFSQQVQEACDAAYTVKR